MATLAIVHDKGTTQRILSAQATAGSGREDILKKVSHGAHRGVEFFDCGLSGEQE